MNLAKLKHEEAVQANNAEKDWIAQNKQPLLDKIDIKIMEFDEQIAEVNNEYKQLKIDYEKFENDFKEKIIEVEFVDADEDRDYVLENNVKSVPTLVTDDGELISGVDEIVEKLQNN